MELFRLFQDCDVVTIIIQKENGKESNRKKHLVTGEL